MNVAFIATVNLDDLSDLVGVAQEINEELTASGFEVISVHAWERPATTQLGLGMTTAVPITQPNQNIT